MRTLLVILAPILLSTIAFSQPADSYQTSIAANLATADSFVNLSSTANTNMCVNAYIFDQNEEMVNCFSSLIAPKRPYFASARQDLLHGSFFAPNTLKIRLAASTPLNGTSCDAGAPGLAPPTPTLGSLVSGMVPLLGPIQGIGGVPFTIPPTPIPAADLNMLTTYCVFTRLGGGVRYNPFHLSPGYVVNSFADTIDINPGDGICADSIGQCTLRAAIMESNARPGDDLITLRAGAYLLSIAGRGEDLSATGDLDITGNLTISGAGAAATIIDGGGIDRVFDIRPGATVTLDAVTVRNGNSRPSGEAGGGIFNQGTMTLTNSNLTDNSADSGGGAYNNGTMTILTSALTNNTSAYYGAGIFSCRLPNNECAGNNNASSAVLAVTDSTIANNRNVGFRGAGIAIVGGQATLTRSTVSGNNSLGQGAGGLLNWAGAFTLINSTVSANSGSISYGGGIENDYGGTFMLSNSTVFGNHVSDGPRGGISNDSGAITLKNTIVANNTTGSANAAADCAGIIVSLGHNLAGGASCGFGGNGDQNSKDPLLAPLSTNGGPTLTHAMLPGSPAIDVIPQADCPLTTDQRGFARPQGPMCDIGAVEYIPGFTPAGPNVVVQPIDDYTHGTPDTLTFTAVTRTGRTSSFTVNFDIGLPPLPAGFSFGNPPVYHYVETTAVFSGPIQMCINYSNNPSISFPAIPRLLFVAEPAHQWVDITTRWDTANHIVCGNATAAPTPEYTDLTFALASRPNDTAAGANVEVHPIDPTTGGTPVSLTFDNVTGAGSTIASSSATGPALPAGFSLGNPPVYFNLQTTAAFSGYTNICFNYSGITFPNGATPQILHFEGGAWVPVTTASLNPPVICGRVTSLSPFAVVRRLDLTPPVILPSIGGTPGTNGWYTSNVTLSWSVTDPESGIASETGCTSANLTVDTPGALMTCAAKNGAGLQSSAQTTIKIDKTLPAITGMPAAGCSLWPPNGKMVQVAAVSATDAMSGLAPGSFSVTGRSNEPSNPKDPDIVITQSGSGGFTVQLRADRLGSGTGRLYTLTATAKDSAGNTATVTSQCTVPDDQSH